MNDKNYIKFAVGNYFKHNYLLWFVINMFMRKQQKPYG